MSIKNFDNCLDELETISTKVFVENARKLTSKDVQVIRNLRDTAKDNIENLSVEKVNQAAVVLNSLLNADTYRFDAGEHKELIESVLSMLKAIRNGIESVLSQNHEEFNEMSFGDAVSILETLKCIMKDRGNILSDKHVEALNSALDTIINLKFPIQELNPDELKSAYEFLDYIASRLTIISENGEGRELIIKLEKAINHVNGR